METVQQYLEAGAADPESYPWESIIYTLKEALGGAAEAGDGEAAADDGTGGEAAADEGAAEDGTGEEGAAEEGEGGEGALDDVLGDMGEEGDGADAAAEGGPAAEGGEMDEDPVGDEAEAAAAPGSPVKWTCTRCTFVNTVTDAVICAVCRVSRNCEFEGPGFVERNAEGRTQLIITSDSLTKNRYLRGQFKVVKYNSEGVFAGKKDRVFEVDFFTKEFRNCDTSGKESFALLAANLYRVERHLDNPKNLKLLFFKSQHPIDLIFQSSTDRQRFIELCALQRKSAIVWAPFFCRENVKESIVRIEGTTVEVAGKKEKTTGVGTFVASRMPYEVLRLWTGCINLQNRSLPLAGPKLEEFLPLDHDVYFLGLQDVPSSLRDGKQIQEFWTNFFGAPYYVVLNTSASDNVFAGIDGKRGDKNSPGCVLIIVKKTALIKLGNIDFIELVEAGESGKKAKDQADVYGVFVSVRIQESLIGVMLLNITPNLPDVTRRNEKVMSMLNRVKCGDALVDVSVRFDYIYIMGSLGYHTLPTDELHAQVAGQLILTDFQECTILAEMCLPDRVLFWHRPRSSKAAILQYSTAPHLGMPNIHAFFDMYVQRPYCYALMPDVPNIKISISKLVFDCDTLPVVRDAQVRSTADCFEDCPVVHPLKAQSHKLVCNVNMTLIPVCPAYEYLRAQSVNISLMGHAEGYTKGKGQVIASALIPLRDLLIPDDPATHSAFVLRLSQVIGILEATVTYVTRK